MSGPAARARELSGGLAYHLRAWRYRQNLWLPFCESLNPWLASLWQKPSDTLIWIGCSAGYSVYPETLKPYNRIVAVDVNFWARHLFQHRFPQAKIDWVYKDLFGFDQPHSSMESLRELLNQYPQADIWLSNLLGQVAYFTRDPLLSARHLQTLIHLLEGRRWLSYHDALSSSSSTTVVRRQQWQPPTPVSRAELAEAFWSATNEAWDHHTEPLAKAQGTPLYLHWSVTPRNKHIIECVHR